MYVVSMQKFYTLFNIVKMFFFLLHYSKYIDPHKYDSRHMLLFFILFFKLKCLWAFDICDNLWTFIISTHFHLQLKQDIKINLFCCCYILLLLQKHGEISVILSHLLLFLSYSFKHESIFIMYVKSVKSLTGQEKICYNSEIKVKVI